MVVVLHNLRPYLMIDQGWDVITADVLANQTLTGPGANAMLAAVRRLQRAGWTIPEPYYTALSTFRNGALLEEPKSLPPALPAGVRFIDRSEYYALPR